MGNVSGVVAKDSAAVTGVAAKGGQAGLRVRDTTAWLQDSLKAWKLDGRFTTDSFMRPGYWRVDMIRDGIADIAVAVRERSTGKRGIVLLAGGGPRAWAVFGAGVEFGNGGDDFDWAGVWSVYQKPTAMETLFDKKSGDVIGSKNVRLQHSCLLVMAMEDGAPSSGGLICWTGKEFRWIHQGE